MRFKYPEFLPHPYIPWRHPIREKLERSDMLKRRSNITIPEFYVGWYLKIKIMSMSEQKRAHLQITYFEKIAALM